MKVSNNAYLQKIKDSVSAITDYTFEMEEQEFFRNRMAQDAVLWHFNRIGTAAKLISTDFKQQHNDIPWTKVENMRTKCDIDVQNIDMLTVWATIEEYIPIIKTELTNLNIE